MWMHKVANLAWYKTSTDAFYNGVIKMYGHMYLSVHPSIHLYVLPSLWHVEGRVYGIK